MQWERAWISAWKTSLNIGPPPPLDRSLRRLIIVIRRLWSRDTSRRELDCIVCRKHGVSTDDSSNNDHSSQRVYTLLVFHFPLGRALRPSHVIDTKPATIPGDCQRPHSNLVPSAVRRPVVRPHTTAYEPTTEIESSVTYIQSGTMDVAAWWVVWSCRPRQSLDRTKRQVEADLRNRRLMDTSLPHSLTHTPTPAVQAGPVSCESLPVGTRLIESVFIFVTSSSRVLCVWWFQVRVNSTVTDKARHSTVAPVACQLNQKRSVCHWIETCALLVFFEWVHQCRASALVEVKDVETDEQINIVEANAI